MYKNDVENTNYDDSLREFTNKESQYKVEKDCDEVSRKRSRIMKTILGFIVFWCGLILVAILYVFFG